MRSIVRLLLKLSRTIDRVVEGAGWLAQGLVIILVAIGFYNVAVRYLGRFIGMQLSSNLFIELQWYIFSLIFFLGFSYILKHGGNVRVDFLYSHLSQKGRSLIDLIGTLIFLIPFCGIGIWVSFNPVLQSWGRLPDGSWGMWEMSSDANGLPRAPIKTMLIVAFVLLLAQAISQAIKYLAILLGYRDVAQTVRAENSEHLPFE